MKLLDLIHPHFGAISICGTLIGDSRNGVALNRCDYDGMTWIDTGIELLADLRLDDPGFGRGVVKFESYNDENTISKIFLGVSFKDAESIKKSNYQVLIDYLEQSDLFDDFSFDEQDSTFRNGINEIHIEVSDEKIIIELYAPSDSGIRPGENSEKGVLRTIAALYRGEQDDWEDFLKDATTLKIKLTYCREDEEYPYLWLVLPEEEYKKDSRLSSMSLTTEALRRIFLMAGYEDASKNWQDWSFERIILDPVTWEPMDVIRIETIVGAKPMTAIELDEALDKIEYWDKERTSPPGVWDETPIG